MGEVLGGDKLCAGADVVDEQTDPRWYSLARSDETCLQGRGAVAQVTSFGLHTAGVDRGSAHCQEEPSPRIAHERLAPTRSSPTSQFHIPANSLSNLTVGRCKSIPQSVLILSKMKAGERLPKHAGSLHTEGSAFGLHTVMRCLGLFVCTCSDFVVWRKSEHKNITKDAAIDSAQKRVDDAAAWLHKASGTKQAEDREELRAQHEQA